MDCLFFEAWHRGVRKKGKERMWKNGQLLVGGKVWLSATEGFIAICNAQVFIFMNTIFGVLVGFGGPQDPVRSSWSEGKEVDRGGWLAFEARFHGLMYVQVRFCVIEGPFRDLRFIWFGLGLTW